MSYSEYRIEDWAIDRQYIDEAETLEIARDATFASDQKAELAIGQTVSVVRLSAGGQGGVMLLLHGEARGALCLGADSQWGDWSDAQSTLTLDDGTVLTVGDDAIKSNAEISGCDRCGDTSFTDDQLVPQSNGQRICGACAGQEQPS